MKIVQWVLSILTFTLVGCSIFYTDSINPYSYTTEDGLSIMYIQPKPPSHDEYTPVTFIYNGIEYEAEGKIRGNSTVARPKKSYTIKFDDDNLFIDDDGTEREKLVLVANFDDNSFIRNRLTYILWNLLDDNFDVTTASRVVYMNGEYHGLYTQVDHYGESFIDDYVTASTESSILTQSDYSLYKNKTHSADFSTATNPTGYEKKLGYPEEGEAGDIDDMVDFIEVIQEDEDFDTNFEAVANAESYYNWWFLISFLLATDNANGNSYHFHDLTTDQWFYIPWDFNGCLGQDYATSRITASADYGLEEDNDIFIKIIDNDYFSDQFEDGYKDLLAGDWSLDNILDQIDILVDEIEDAAHTDEEVWTEYYQEYRDRRSDFTTFDEEIDYIKEWITTQHGLWAAVYE